MKPVARGRKASKDSVEKKPAAKAVAKPAAEGPFEVFVGGLPWSMGEGDIEELFRPYGEVLEVRLLRTNDGKSKGIGFVKFDSE